VEYGRIVSEAWRITWRHRFLWWFGPFVSSSSCGYQGNFDLPDSWIEGLGVDDIDPDLARLGEAATLWAAANVGLIALAGLLFLLFVLAMIVLSCIAHGSLIGSIGRIAAGETVTLGEAWRQGTRLAWRFVRLWLLALVVVLLGLAVVAVCAGVLVLVGSSGGAALAAAILLGVGGFLVVLFVALTFGVAVLYAERAIAIDDLRARTALARGIALLRVHPGRSAILWLIGLGLGIVIAAAIAAAAVVLLIPLGGMVVAAYLASGFGPATLGLGLVALLVLVSVLWVLAGIANTFTTAVWTLGYLGLTERYPPR
jgi:hypothetical protein